jgi:hypothetical protein
MTGLWKEVRAGEEVICDRKYYDIGAAHPMGAGSACGEPLGSLATKATFGFRKMRAAR